MNPTTPPPSPVDGKAGYSTPTDTIKETAFITGYEARNESNPLNIRGNDTEPATSS